MDCKIPRSSVHGIFQARILKWVAISFIRGSSWPSDRIHVSSPALAGGFFITVPPRKPLSYVCFKNILLVCALTFHFLYGNFFLFTVVQKYDAVKYFFILPSLMIQTYSSKGFIDLLFVCVFFSDLLFKNRYKFTKNWEEDTEISNIPSASTCA